MKKLSLLKSLDIRFTISLILLSLSPSIYAQQSIAWQKSIGTEYSDNAQKIFNDDDGNIVVVGQELHQDFTGNLKTYMMVSKFDLKGEEIWKKYHDVAYETFSLPLDYYIGDQYYTAENGEKLISLVISIGGRKVLYKLYDTTGEYYAYTEIPSNVFTTTRNNIQAVANVQCSIQQACYGSDSLTVQKWDPNPVIGWNPLQWTFGLKQNIRTTPIQGHYDFNNQDITFDTLGNVYLLTQIERWDFQFCTDCGDAFIDAYSEIFKFDTAGQLVKNVKLKTAKAVVSNMRFVSFDEENIVIKIDDINASGTAVLSTIYNLNSNLVITKQFTLDDQFNILQSDSLQNLYGCTNVYDEADPDIIGMSDVKVSKYSPEGILQWKSYYGGSSFDYPKGLVVTKDHALAFLANTESIDFDIEENHGAQDMWLVKLQEGGSTSIEGHSESIPLSIFPNPCKEDISVSVSAEMEITVFDIFGRKVLSKKIDRSDDNLDLHLIPAGIYMIYGVNIAGQKFSTKFSKL